MNLIPRNSVLDFDNIFNGFWSPSREVGESTDVAVEQRPPICGLRAKALSINVTG
jgi:hypothetical protein